MVVVVSKKLVAGDEALAADANLLGHNLSLRVEAQSTPDTTVKVKAGTALFSRKTFVEISDTNSTGVAVAVTNPRIDVVSLTSTGGITITQGTEAASPSRPSIPNGEIALADIYIRTGTGLVIKDTDDSTNNYIRQDMRTPLMTKDMTSGDAGTLTVGSTSDAGGLHYHLHKAGIFSRLMTSSGTTNIAHGLGRTPKFMRFWMAQQSSNVLTVDSFGFYDGSVQAAVWRGLDTNGAVEIGGMATGYAIYFDRGFGGGAGGNTLKGSVTFTSTGAVITWTLAGSPAGTAYFFWEAM